MKVVTQIQLTFSLILILFLLSSSLAYYNTGQVEEKTRSIIDDSAALNQQTGMLRVGLFQVQQSLLNHLRTRDSAEGEKYRQQEQGTIKQMASLISQQSALGRFVSADERMLLEQQITVLHGIASQVFDAHQQQLELSQFADARRREANNQIAILLGTLERVSPTLIQSDSYLQKMAQDYANSLQQASALLARSFFEVDRDDVEKNKNLILNLQTDIDDSYAELLDAVPALKAEQDFVIAQQQVGTALFGDESVLDTLLQLRNQDELVRRNLAQIQDLYQKMSARVGDLSQAVHQRNLDSGTLVQHLLTQLKQGQVLALGLGILIVSVVGFLLTRQIRSPLRYAQRVMQQLSAGDYCQHIQTRWPFEFAELLRQLDSLMQANRRLITEVKVQSSRLESLSQENGRLTEEVSQLSEEQFQSVSRISSAVCELEQVSSQVKLKSDVNMEACQSIVGLSRQGIAAIQDNLGANERMAQQLLKSSEVIESVAQKSHAISNIVEVIENIANQTNLLALNAAIESARAGDKGRGFAVVADEVRELANRTMTSTGSIQSMISDLQQTVQFAVNSIEQTDSMMQTNTQMLNQSGQVMEQIDFQTEALSENAIFIASSTGEQHQACAEISHAIEVISDAFRSSGSKAIMVAANSRELTQMSKEQVIELQKFVTEVEA